MRHISSWRLWTLGHLLSAGDWTERGSRYLNSNPERTAHLCIHGAAQRPSVTYRMRNYPRCSAGPGTITGKNEMVPANMTYEQWYDKNVRGRPEAEQNETMQKNRASDRRQFEKYKEILGDDAPKSLDAFQKMKYTDSEKYDYAKLDYSRRKKLADYPEQRLPNAENVTLLEGKFKEYLFDGKNQQGLAKGNAITDRLGIIRITGKSSEPS